MSDGAQTEDLDQADAIVAFLRSHGAERQGHAGGRTLLDHLLGTAAVVRRWGQPAWLQHAALIHSVYGTEAYSDQLISPSRRSELAAVAGPRPERLAYLFCAMPRRPLFAGTHRWARELPLRAVPGAPNGGDVQPATRGELDALVLLHMANLADQASAPNGAPGRWLVRVRDLGELLADSDTVTAPGWMIGLAELTDEDEALVRRSYAQAATAPEPARTSALALAAAGVPVLGEPCVWLAYLARTRGDGSSARAWAACARGRLESLGTPWDKRLAFEEWLTLVDALDGPAAIAVPERISEPRALLAAVVEGRGSIQSVTGQSVTGRSEASDDATGRARFQRYVEGLADAADPGSGGRYPDLPSRPWHDPHDFPLAGALESHYPAIREEILALDGTVFHRESERIGRTGDWDVAFLYERGRRHDDVCGACPVTAHCVETHRTVRSMAGLIYVSRMRPGTHIGAHRGPTNLRLRCHLGISVPDGDCAIRVGERTERWHEGRCLVFDDFYEHEAWNHTDEDRIVLIVDLWHPALSDAEVTLLEGLHAYTYRHARRLSRYWAANVAAAETT